MRYLWKYKLLSLSDGNKMDMSNMYLLVCATYFSDLNILLCYDMKRDKWGHYELCCDSYAMSNVVKNESSMKTDMIHLSCQILWWMRLLWTLLWFMSYLLSDKEAIINTELIYVQCPVWWPMEPLWTLLLLICHVQCSEEWPYFENWSDSYGMSNEVINETLNT